MFLLVLIRVTILLLLEGTILHIYLQKHLHMCFSFDRRMVVMLRSNQHNCLELFSIVPSNLHVVSLRIFPYFTDSLFYPTDPSNVIDNNFCASTANSIGSLFKTSFAYPLTIKPIAFSVGMPRWLQ